MNTFLPTIESVVLDEAVRRDWFPVCRQSIFLAHAGVTVLPSIVAEAMISHTRNSCGYHQEFGEVLRDVNRARVVSAGLIEADSREIALLGPTSLGLSLFANGLDWQPGDEVICYADDYPANVYPWMQLERLGVRLNYLRPDRPGEITPDLVEAALTPRTRLVALASCHFLTGYRIDVDAIGALAHRHGVLFSLDAIQTLGAFPLSVRHVDFLSADAHKWMLGPLAIGIVMVKKEHFEKVRPTLLGAWNVISPNFIAQDKIQFPDSAQRYEPGVLNISGIYGMKAAIEMLQAVGIETIGARLLALKNHFVKELLPDGFEFLGPVDSPNASGITTFSHPGVEAGVFFKKLEENGVVASLRFDRSGKGFIRISPHFYNTIEELDRVISVLKQTLRR